LLRGSSSAFREVINEVFIKSQGLDGERMITDLERRFEIGSIVVGTVTHVAGWGCVLALCEGVKGRVERSEISWWRSRPRVEDLVQIGQERRARVIRVDPLAQEVVLSIRQVGTDPWKGSIRELYPISCRYEAVVQTIIPSGAFAMLEPGLDGFIPLSGMRKYHGRFIDRANDVVTEGDRIAVIVSDYNFERFNLVLELAARLGRSETPLRSLGSASNQVQGNETDQREGWDSEEWPWSPGEPAISSKQNGTSFRNKPDRIRVESVDRSTPAQWNLPWK
jgi:predicted RNA-binding protein with RPS1 domain